MEETCGDFDTINEIFSRIARHFSTFKLAYFFRVVCIILCRVFIYHNRPRLCHSVAIIKFFTFPRQFFKNIYNVYFYSFDIQVSHELRSLLQESVPYVKLYRYNPKHLYPKLNGLGDNGKRKVWIS